MKNFVLFANYLILSISVFYFFIMMCNEDNRIYVNIIGAILFFGTIIILTKTKFGKKLSKLWYKANCKLFGSL